MVSREGFVWTNVFHHYMSAFYEYNNNIEFVKFNGPKNSLCLNQLSLLRKFLHPLVENQSGDKKQANLYPILRPSQISINSVVFISQATA